MKKLEEMTVAPSNPMCKTCGADVDENDPQGRICTLCGRYEFACTCDPNEVVGPDPLHPDGRCTCAGEGRCAWCKSHQEE